MMLEKIRRRQPGASIGRIMWWQLLHGLCYLWMGSCYGYRAWGMGNIPRSGPVLFVSNHQSFLDPILVGLGSHRRQFYAMARSTLFHNRYFAWLIRSINAFPVERGTSDTAAMRRALEVLKGGHALLVYPEGTRTVDGQVGTFHNGIMLLIKRAKPWVVPVAIDGAFEAWPKGQALPRAVGQVRVMYGKPYRAEDLLAIGSHQAIAELHGAVDRMKNDLARVNAESGEAKGVTSKQK